MTTMAEWKQTMGLFQQEGVSPTADGGGAGLFVRLSDGDSVTGVFLGEPYARRVCWDEGQHRTVKFDKALHPERSAKWMVAFNFYDSQTKELRIIEVNKRTFGQICELTEKLEKQGSGLERWECKITRRGSSKQTQYWVDTTREVPAGGVEKLARMMSTDRHDLEAIMNDGQVATAAKETHMTRSEPMRAPVKQWNAPQPAAPAPAAPQPAAPAPGADFDLF